MNNDRRKRLNRAITLLSEISAAYEEASQIVEEIKDEETDAYENMPESLQNSERGEQSQEAINALETALDTLQNCNLDDVIASIEEATA